MRLSKPPLPKTLSVFAKGKTIVFDFDGTIAEEVEFPAIGEPIWETIERMQACMDAGIEVVIQSCRWSEHELSTPESAAQNMVEALRWLDRYDVPYDRLVAGKPLAELYVDDKACDVHDYQRLDDMIVSLASEYPVDGSLRAALSGKYWVSPSGKVFDAGTEHGTWPFRDQSWKKEPNAKKVALAIKSHPKSADQEEVGLNALAGNGWVRVFDSSLSGDIKTLPIMKSFVKEKYIPEDREAIINVEFDGAEAWEGTALEFMSFAVPKTPDATPAHEFMRHLKKYTADPHDDFDEGSRVLDVGAGGHVGIEAVPVNDNEIHVHRIYPGTASKKPDLHRAMAIDWLNEAADKFGVLIIEANARHLVEATSNDLDLEDEADAVAQELRSKHPGLTLDYHYDDRHGTLIVSRIVVPRDKRGQGIGTEVMNRLIEFAKTKGLKTALTPEPIGERGSKERLRKFYKGFGFKKNKDPRVSESMMASQKVKAGGDEHSYGCLMVDFPEDISKEVIAWTKENVSDELLYTDPEKPTDYGRESHVHTTVNYGLDPKMDRDEIKKFLGLVEGPIKVKLGKISKFDPEKYDVIKIEVESPSLHEMHNKIKDSLGVPGETYPEYKPHLTLAYVKKGMGDDLIGEEPFAGLEFDLTKFDYSCPPKPGAKDKHTKYDLNTLKAHLMANTDSDGGPWVVRYGGGYPKKKHLYTTETFSNRAKAKQWIRNHFFHEDATIVPASEAPDQREPRERPLRPRAAQFDDLRKAALRLIEDDPTWKSLLDNAESAQAYGQLQQSVRDARSDDELKKAWESHMDLPWEAVVSESGGRRK